VKNNMAIIEEQFQLLIKKFLTHEVSVEKFCSNFTNLWIQHRNEQEKIKQAWNEPYDQQLIEAHLRGELSTEEFGRLYSDLWGLPEKMYLYELIDSIHSACSTFNPSPEQEWEINEAQLRLEVQTLIENFRNSL
jgi:hypothetical protein